MALQIPNPTKQKRFNGHLSFEGHNFVFEIFLTPLEEDTLDFQYVVDHIRKRRRKGERGACLGTTKPVITKHLQRQITSAYGFVRERGTMDEASGSLQIYDWFGIGSPQVWVNDLCRSNGTSSSGTRKKSHNKSSVSPVKVLFFLFEQLAITAVNARTIYLNVETDNETVLCPLYERYGFTRETKHTYNDDYIHMKKTVIPDPTYANFPFYLSRSHNKTSKRKQN
jgi:hypothetical protein